MPNNTSTKLFYKQSAQKHKKYLPLKHLLNPECRTIIPEIELKDDIKLLDVACGNGKLLFTLAGILKSFEFKGIDVSEKMIRRCKRKNIFSEIEFLTSPADNLPFDDNYFDIITCTNAVSLFAQRVKAIDEIYRVLKPMGKFYILDGVRGAEWKQKFDKMLRQTKFIQPRKKYLPRSSIIRKSYLIIETK